MFNGVIKRRVLGACAVFAALGAIAPAGASAATGCTAPTLTQTFLSFKDLNWYASAPGERYDSFTGSGWVLSGGAKIVWATLHDGTKGYVLDLPSGAKAVSPAMCVTNDYPTARAMVRTIAGYVGVNAYVAYLGSTTWGPAQATGVARTMASGWGLAGTMYIHTGSVVGWQLAQFTLVGGGSASEYQLYNFFVDPRMH